MFENPDMLIHGDSELAWCPQLKTGDSFGEMRSGQDNTNITAHGVTRMLSFSYNPSQNYELYGYTEFIEVKFATAVYPTAIKIGENRGMCSIVRIQGRDSADGGAFFDLWRSTETGADRQACADAFAEATRYRMFQPIFCQHPFKVDVLRLELDTRSVTDWNEIDFVELTGTEVLQAGVLPARTSGVLYVPNPGFVGSDSLRIIPYDCPFATTRSGDALDVPILVAGSFPPPSPPPTVLVPEVHLGVLLPMFGTVAAGYSAITWSARGGAYQALRELNDKSDGVDDELLPNTQLRFAYRDSKCDSTSALQATLQLTQYVFQGSGVSAIIGAGCSSASETAAQVAEGSNVPIVSPSSLSPSLSNGRAYPYFVRTVCEAMCSIRTEDRRSAKRLNSRPP